MQCYVCSEVLDGDPAYVQHHLNSCLDRQGPSNGSPRRDSQQQTAAPVPAVTSSTLTLSVTSSNEEHDRLLAIALSSTESEPTSSEPSNRNPTAGSCPCCHQSWLTLGLTTGDSPSDLAALDGTEQEQRASHVEACLMAREEEEDAGQRGDWPAGGQHGRAEDDDDGDEAAERKGRQVPNGVGAGMKGATTSRAGGGGDAVHETAVLSTPDLIHLLATSLSASHASPHGRTSEAYLATDLVHHVPTRLKDYGWGCGYKNAQMIFSAFRHLPQLAPLQPKCSGPMEDVVPIPPIRWWQETIEAAWRQGFDPEGAAHFKFRLVNSRRWIGTTEIYTALSFLGIRTQIVDFPKTKGGSGTNQNLVNFILDYFRQPNFFGAGPPPPPRDVPPVDTVPRSAFEVLTASRGTPVHRTGQHPLYLQHQGHSRTIVGIEIGKRSRVEGAESNGIGAGGGKLGSKVKGLTKVGKGTKGGKKSGGPRSQEEEEADGGAEEEVWLLLFDPGKPVPQDFKKSAAALAQARFGRHRSTSPAPNSEERDESPPLPKKVRPSPPAPAAMTPKFGEVLKLFRVNMRELKKKDDYQVLFIDPHAPPLTLEEKELRKKVSSIVIGGSAA
ncbi:hypothetical protein BMF94_3415 [Rhodotorula taiwanensis]|uniref:UFSP1/2/DUB catalytic domain-containing protein n=1 Tax=Rhodotorula taiwanensis TaxID=741276 RepID=A0A2S5B9M8_9BASI|nr:hypothetical protein BMF94_3415 [Rhodotorula taiwanensis]